MPEDVGHSRRTGPTRVRGDVASLRQAHRLRDDTGTRGACCAIGARDAARTVTVIHARRARAGTRPGADAETSRSRFRYIAAKPPTALRGRDPRPARCGPRPAQRFCLVFELERASIGSSSRSSAESTDNPRHTCGRNLPPGRPLRPRARRSAACVHTGRPPSPRGRQQGIPGWPPTALGAACRSGASRCRSCAIAVLVNTLKGGSVDAIRSALPAGAVVPFPPDASFRLATGSLRRDDALSIRATAVSLPPAGDPPRSSRFPPLSVPLRIVSPSLIFSLLSRCLCARFSLLSRFMRRPLPIRRGAPAGAETAESPSFESEQGEVQQ